MQAARGASLSTSDTEADEPTEPTRSPRLIGLFWVLGLGLLAVDQWVKDWAVANLAGEGRREVFGDWFGLRLTRNPGAAFSTGEGFTEVLSVIAICAVCLVVFLSFRLGSTGWALGLGFLLAGVGGNLADRLFREPGPMSGHVIDMFELPNWPIFNVADICINIAAGIIILQTVRGLRVDGTRHD